MGNVYSIIYMNLPNLMEVQESKHAVVTLKISFCGNHESEADCQRWMGQGVVKGSQGGSGESGEGVWDKEVRVKRHERIWRGVRAR